MNKKWLVFIGLVVCQFSISVSAEVIRDYFAEPGLNPFKETLNQSLNEHIDPFNGILQLKHQDVKIPGNGGLDINISRTYSQPQRNSGGRLFGVEDYHSSMGVGWNMHFGRVLFNGNLNLSPGGRCVAGPNDVSTQDNPVLEFADGSRELLVRAVSPTGTALDYLITRSRWKAKCITAGTISDGLLVTSPDGTVYRMDRMKVSHYTPPLSATESHTSFTTSRITDTNNNWINFSYLSDDPLSTDYSFYSAITTSDNRYVEFRYLDKSGNRKLLEKIYVKSLATDNCDLTGNSNCQVWEFQYETVGLPEFYFLKKVLLPHHTSNILDRLEWVYSYYDENGSPNPDNLNGAGARSLKTVHYPFGTTYESPPGNIVSNTGSITYQYKYINFNMNAGDYSPTNAIVKKEIAGPGVQPGSWTFDYQAPRVDGTEVINTTTITAPNNTTYIYRHVGYSFGGIGTYWRVGLLKESETRTTNSNALNKRAYK